MSANILFINPKHPYKLDSPPLGIGYLLQYGRAKTESSYFFIDENFSDSPDSEIINIVNKYGITHIGISFPSSAIMRVREISRLVRNNFGNSVLLFAGGYHPTSEPELTLRLMPEFDFLVIGEGEPALPKLQTDWREADNIAYFEGDKFVQNPSSFISNIDDAPFPDRNDYHKQYFIPSTGVIAGIFGKVATIMSSRGCPYACNFCSSKIIQKTVRYHSTDYVISEIEHILSTVGEIDYLYFLDVMFLAKWSRAEELCLALIRSGLNKRFRWATTVAANVVDEEKVRLMKEAGCFYLSFGFESASDHVLKLINKKATARDNQRAVDICRKYSVLVNSAFLFGIPGETEEDLYKSCDFVKRNNLFSTGVNIMKPLPGSPYYYDLVQQGRIEPSIEAWHEVSSIYVKGTIYNDTITEVQYEKAIQEFNSIIKYKRLWNHFRVNGKLKAKHKIKKVFGKV